MSQRAPRILRILQVLLQALWFLSFTYVFWVIATIILIGQSDPFLYVLWPIAALFAFFKFPAFLIPPTIAAFAGLVAIAALAIRRGYRYRVWWPLAVNVVFLVLFLGVAEAYRSALMHGQAWSMAAHTFHTHTMTRSLAIGLVSAPAHAELTVDGVDYIWSYSELKFVRRLPQQ